MHREPPHSSAVEHATAKGRYGLIKTVLQMDQIIPARSPGNYRSIILEMRRDASPGLNMLYLSGFAETLAVIERQNAQAPGTHDLNINSIARVLRAWGDFEGESWAGGFVLELFDARRVYVESYADGPDWGLDCRVSVAPMPADIALPELQPRHDSELHGWAKDLPELGDYLRRLGSAVRVS